MSDQRAVLEAAAIMAGLLLIVAVISPKWWIRTGCRLIAIGEGSAYVRREMLYLLRNVIGELRSRTEELRREYRVANSQAGLEREA